MCQDWKCRDGRTDSCWGSHEGLPGGGDEGVASLEEVGNGAPKPHDGLQFGPQIPPCHEMLVESLSFSEWPGLWGGAVLTWGVVPRQRPGRRVLSSLQLWVTGVHRAAGSPKEFAINDTNIEVTLGTGANTDTG